MVIFIEITAIDGAGNILGGAGPCVLRSTGGLPSLGYIQLDEADLSGMPQAELNNLILHEMGHVLGFGTLWPDQGLLTGAVADGGTDPRFTGSVGIQRYHQLGGQQTTVPVEAGGGPGTEDSHWRESVFDTELMTGFLGGGANPLTGMTIGSIQDLGYAVDYASAEPLGFTVNVARARLLGGTTTFERPLSSPIIIMDPTGRMIGRRPR